MDRISRTSIVARPSWPCVSRLHGQDGRGTGIRLAVALVMLLGISSVSLGEEHAAALQQGAAIAEVEHINYAHPTPPEPGILWPGSMMVAVVAMFLMAAFIGPVVRAEMPEEVPPAHSHDEPPGASGHHGPGGTVQPAPENEEPGHGHH